MLFNGSQLVAEIGVLFAEVQPRSEVIVDHELLLRLRKDYGLQVLLLQFMAEFPEPDCDIFIDVSATKEICGELV